MKAKRVILIGKTGSGKTTLIQKVEGLNSYKKTQSIESYNNFIDTPGEYLEHRPYYSALINSAIQADVIAFVEDCTSHQTWLPPQMANAFVKPVIGIITKITTKGVSESDIQAARARLMNAGANKIFEVSSLEDVGIEALKEYLA